MEIDHTFVICAYNNSKYIEDCIKSLKSQTLQSNIIAVTHTPSDFLSSLMNKYNIPLIVNTGIGGITQDWNFGLNQVKTQYATIAHQDDIYEPDYLKLIMDRIYTDKNPIIAFTDYYEIRNSIKTKNVKMLKIKRIMLLPLRIKAFQRLKFIRRIILAFGDPICCPSVTYNLCSVFQPVFENNFKSAEDWEAWEKLSKLNGSFIYVATPLMCHRIYEESTTSEIIRDGKRIEENYIMFCKFWPKWIAKIINKIYTRSEKSNEL